MFNHMLSYKGLKLRAAMSSLDEEGRRRMDCDRRCDDNDKGKINVIKVKELKFIVLNW